MEIDTLKTHFNGFKDVDVNPSMGLSMAEKISTISFLGYFVSKMGERLAEAQRKMREVENR